MKRKLDTRFPAARIKKIMQTDEDVGKIAQATPVLVSKAVELFLQDLCRKTYEITAERSAKTVSEAHLKQCVAANSDFDFLQTIVSKASEGGQDEPDDQIGEGNQQRSAVENESEEEEKRPRGGHGKEQSSDVTATKGRSKPFKTSSKVVSESAHGPPTLFRKKGSKNRSKAQKESLYASHCNAEEVDHEEKAKARGKGTAKLNSVIGMGQESKTLEVSKKSPRSFDLNLDPGVEGESLVSLESSLHDAPSSLFIKREEGVEGGTGEEFVGPNIVIPAASQMTFKPMCVDEEEDYDCDD